MKRTPGSLVGPAVLTAAVLALVTAFALIAAGYWRQGLGVAGAALGVTGVLRLVLSTRLAGPLRVRRSRLSDAVLTLGLGAALVILAVVVPDQPRAR